MNYGIIYIYLFMFIFMYIYIYLYKINSFPRSAVPFAHNIYIYIYA